MAGAPRPGVRRRIARPVHVLLAPGKPIAAWLERLAGMQFVERSVTIGAQAFAALIPLMIVYSAVVPLADARSFAQRLIEKLKLSGSAAESVHQAIAPPGTVAEGVSVLGFLILVVAALSFARAMQRMYETAYKLPASGMKGTPWHLLWIALIPAYLTLRPVIAALAGGLWHAIGSLLLAVAAWLITPYILLGRRMSARRLAPGALITAAGMTGLSVASLIYLPHSLSSSARNFGTIGVAFAILGWLIGGGFVLAASAAAGAVALERIDANPQGAAARMLRPDAGTLRPRPPS
jgi:membrane protein